MDKYRELVVKLYFSEANNLLTVYEACIENGNFHKAASVFLDIQKNMAKLYSAYTEAFVQGKGGTLAYLNFHNAFNQLQEQFGRLVNKHNYKMECNLRKSDLTNRVLSALTQFSENQQALGLDLPNRSQCTLGLVRFGHFPGVREDEEAEDKVIHVYRGC